MKPMPSNTQGQRRKEPTDLPDDLAKFADWYHAFDSLGVRVTQKAGIYSLNQRCKEGIILGYLRTAIEKSKKTFHSTPSVLELFCADGYYAAHARRMGAHRVTGVDFDKEAIDQAKAMWGYLFGDSGDFLAQDVHLFSPKEPFDVVLCCGGLYHLVDPQKILRDCFSKFCKKFLIVQSVVSLENEDEGYFVSPAPGWRHGCRFSAAFLRRSLAATGWKIIDSHSNELEGNERLCDRGSVYFLCERDSIPPEAKTGRESVGKAPDGPVLCQVPNQFAPTPHVDASETSVLFGGYQAFELQPHGLLVSPNDHALRRKQELLTPYFCPRFLGARTFLDLGASAGFFSFWALQNGAEKVTAVDMDETYLGMIATAQRKFNYRNLEIRRANVAEWHEPADVVLALALLHWIYSCTSSFGSLDAAVQKLAQLTKYILLVEWVDPADPAIDFFHHTDWNRHLTREPYVIEAFEKAMARHFVTFKAIGEVSPTRRLYVAFRTGHEIDLSGPFALAFGKDQVISGRRIATYRGIDYWSYVFDGGEVIHKQATLDLAKREMPFLSSLSGKFFPKVFAVEDRGDYSLLTTEKIHGQPLSAAAQDISVTRERFREFIFDCLVILTELKKRGIQHRDIRPENMLIREGRPVVIDFGWAVSEAEPYFTPDGLGCDGRPPDGSFCDAYSMGKLLLTVNRHRYEDFDVVFELMCEPDASMRITDPVLLSHLVKALG